MNPLKLLRYLLVDMHIFGVADPAPADPAPAPADPAPAPADPAPETNIFGQLPETWRTDMVQAAGFQGDDATSLTNLLERTTDLNGFLGNYKSMQDKIRKGEVSTGLPEDPTDEQLAAYREANGIPAEADKYDLDGFGLGDEEAEIFKAVAEASHGGLVPNDVLRSQVEAYQKASEAVAERRAAQDNVDAQQGAQALKEAWGNDYARNLNMVEGLLAQIPEGIRDKFKEARLSDGRGILNSPEMMQFLASVQAKVDPAAAVVPGSSNPMKTIKDEIASIHKTMSDDPDTYWKDKGMQDRLEQLYEAEERLNAQA